MVPEQIADYVVVGAGSSGCVLAHRLSENKNVHVILLEAGGWDDKPEIHAAEFYSTMALWSPEQSSRSDWGYVTERQPFMHERRIQIARGKVIGGCSSINALMYVRGNRLDYDHWNYLGNDGWSFDAVLPFFKKSEDFDGGETEYRGVNGPLSVVNHPNPTPIAQAFVGAAQELGFGGPKQDYNGEQQEGSAFYYQTTRTRDLKRCSSAVAFLHPILDRPNLTIMVAAQATRLVIEQQRVVGLEYRQHGVLHSIGVSKEVILSCGTFETPKLLMLSGIGPAEQLKKQNVSTVLVDLPGVGQCLQDHLYVPVCFQSKHPHPKATLVSEAGLFTRTRTGIQRASPDLQFTFGSAKFLGGASNLTRLEGPGFTFAPIALRPQSSGYICLRSTDPYVPAEVNAHYLECDADVDVLVSGIKLARELAHAAAFDEFRGEELLPGDAVIKHAQLRDFVRMNATTLWHPVGTCRMGLDKYAVVDPQLRIYGIDNLRVADASIMPAIVAGNTNAACIMIGEKAASLIQETYT